MQAADVVDLEESVNDQLPVCGAPNSVLAVEAVARESQRIEDTVDLAEVALDVKRGFGDWVEHCPTQAVPHGRGQLPQAMQVAIEIGKGLGAGHPGQRSVEGVGPGVVGADKVSSATHLPFLRQQPCAAMATDIEENPQLAISTARDQHWRAAEIESQHRPRLGKLVGVTQA